MAKLTGDEMEFLYPIQSVTIHPGGHLTVNRASRFKPQIGPNNGKEKITNLSKKSLRRLNHIMQCTTTELNSMITLTYGEYYPPNGKIVKKDWGKIRQFILQYTDDYIWFLEFQKRGAPHLHILLSIDEIAPYMRLSLLSTWVRSQIKSNWWQMVCPIDQRDQQFCRLIKFNAHPTIWEMIRKPDGAKRYVAKYATKTHQKEVPARFSDVGRFWGASKSVSRVLGVTVDTSAWELHKLLEKFDHSAARQDIPPKFIWSVTDDTPKTNGTRTSDGSSDAGKLLRSQS